MTRPELNKKLDRLNTLFYEYLRKLKKRQASWIHLERLIQLRRKEETRLRLQCDDLNKLNLDKTIKVG